MALLNRDGEVIEPTSISNGAASAGGLSITPLPEWTPGSGEGLLLDPDAVLHSEQSFDLLIGDEDHLPSPFRPRATGTEHRRKRPGKSPGLFCFMVNLFHG